jgi:hypothetical protein
MFTVKEPAAGQALSQRQIRVFAIIELLIMYSAVYLGGFIEKWLYALIGAVGLMVLAIPFMLLGSKKKEAFFYVSAMLNTLATALSINIYYIYKKISFNFSLAAIIAAIAVMVYLISDIAIMKTKGKKLKDALLYIMLFGLIACAAAWFIEENKFLFSFMFLYGFFVSALLFIGRVKTKTISGKRFALAHFVLFFVIISAVLIAVSEREMSGEIIEYSVKESKKNKRRKKLFSK